MCTNEDIFTFCKYLNNCNVIFNEKYFYTITENLTGRYKSDMLDRQKYDVNIMYESPCCPLLVLLLLSPNPSVCFWHSATLTRTVQIISQVHKLNQFK